MNKQELIDHISTNLAIGKTLTSNMLDELSLAVTNELESGSGEVVLPGIGKLKTAKREARTARNPKTGETVKVKAKTVVKFSAAKALKEAVA